tara:strand:- start:336 stop:1004 length:669 start_codon:yes stop_codon:yes gene_type:complete
LGKFILQADESMLRNIDSLVYTQEKPPKDIEFSDLISINPMSVLPEPPKNTSDVTKSEIKQVSELTQSLTSAQKNLVMLVDKDPNLLFVDLLGSNILPLPMAKFKKSWNILEPVIKSLKNKFNRPRPEQLVSVFPRFYGDLSINVIETKTHHTPAYPSGHTAYATLMASILSDIYPNQSSKFYEIANLAGHARVLQGVHYPSDNDAAMVITSAIWQDIKHKI